MNKKFRIPSILFILSLIIGASFFYFMSPSAHYNYFEQEIEQGRQYKEALVGKIQDFKNMKKELLAQEKTDSAQLKELNYQIEELHYQLKDREKEMIRLKEEQLQNRLEEEKQQAEILLWGTITTLLGSLLLAVLSFFAQRLFKNSKTSTLSKLLILFFILCLFFMLLSLGEKEDGAAICFAILGAGALISYTINKNKEGS